MRKAYKKTEPHANGAWQAAGRGYTDCDFEDDLHESGEVHFLPMRKHNASRQFPPWIRFSQDHYRKRVETAGSLLEQLLPKYIHAVTVTALGFELKVALFVLALSINFLG
jgi:hypothetical protein